MAKRISWELYLSLLSVLREGSLSGAARALGMTQPTLGRHIATLEGVLGVGLFTRSQVGLLPTEAALALRTHAEAMESTAAALERTALSQGAGVRGVVRVSASEIISVEVLPPIVAQLRGRHPSLTVELVLTDRVQDLLRREVDIAVRMIRPDQEQLVARRIGRIELGLYARRDYLEQQGEPRELSELASHSVIGYDQPSAFIRKAEQAVRGFTRNLFAVRTDSNLAQLALIRCGAGIGVCQVPLARRHSDLKRVLAKAFALHLDTSVTMHEDLRHSPRCRATFDALVEGLQRYVAWA
jgi:DNA-binding transcriptional LysR family regulator